MRDIRDKKKDAAVQFMKNRRNQDHNDENEGKEKSTLKIAITIERSVSEVIVPLDHQI